MATSNYLAVQWFGLQAFNASGPGSVPVGGTKIPQVTRCSQKKKERRKIAMGCIGFKNHCVPIEPNRPISITPHYRKLRKILSSLNIL